MTLRAKFIYTWYIAIAIVLSGCGERIVPDELVLIKYNPLEIPTTLTLPEPDPNAKNLGYTSARTQVTNIVQQDLKRTPQPPLNTDGASEDILKLLKLSSVDMNISTLLQQPFGERVIVVIDEEQQRLARNLAENVPLTQGEVPRILAKRTRAGIDTLFGE